jgi:hypothetical protein
MFIRRFLIDTILLCMNVSITTRYIFIFWLKNPAAFNNEFWFQFTCTWITGCAILLGAVWNFLTPFYLPGYYMCSGKDPTEANEKLPKIYRVLETVAVLLHVIIYLKIYIYKRKGNSILLHGVFNLKSFGLKDIEKSLLANYNITQFVGILIVIGSAIIVKPLEGANPKDYGHYPLNLIVYFRNLIGPPLEVFAFIANFYVERNYFKELYDEIIYLHFPTYQT